MTAPIIVVGPSGAGKDSLMRELAQRLPAIQARRVIDRPQEPSEDHEAVSSDAWEARRHQGGFVWSWLAHGHRYGIPLAIETDLQAGRLVMINGSRAALASARERWPAAIVLHVDASPALRAERLARRGREAAAAVALRLAREVPGPIGERVVRIENDGDLERAVQAAMQGIRSWLLADAGPQRRLAVWAVPTAAQALAWQQVTERCAQRLHAVPVPAHLTVSSGLSDDADRWGAWLQRHAQVLPAWRQSLGGVYAGGTTFQALVVGSGASASLRWLRSRLRAAAGLPAARFQPHASLVYGRPGDPEFAALARLWQDRPWPQWTIDGLELWSIAGPLSAWRRVARVRLV